MNTSFAQFNCGADEARARLAAADTSFETGLKQMNADINNYIKLHPNNSGANNAAARVASAPLYYIPCVVHVIYDGDPTIGTPSNPTTAQITGAINYINQVYNGSWTGKGGAITGTGDLQIQLVLATLDPNNVSTTGIDRVDGSGLPGYSTNGANSKKTNGASEISVKNLSRWDPEKYYNIWVVNKIDSCTGIYCGCSCDAGYTVGYAYFPMANHTSATNMGYDGTIILASGMKAGQKVLPHEVGHALNLYHPFQGNTGTGTNNCPVNDSPTTQGDMCADTDPITNPQLAPNSPFACRTGTNPCTGTPFIDNTEKNYMSYTNCYQLFTDNQKSRMQASAVVTQRSSLITSWANNVGTYPAPFVAPVAAASTPASTTTTDLAGILNITLGGRTVYSLDALQDGGYLDNSVKWYDAFQLLPSTTYILTVTLLNNNNASQMGVWMDYNNDGNFNMGNEQLYLQSNIPSGGTTTIVNIPFTTPTNWVAVNNFVRLRITEDLSNIYSDVNTTVTNNCTSLTFGQAEDYPVYLTGGALPVTLTSFTGVKKSAAIQLNWNTAQEFNMLSFDVERSLNTAAFTSIGNVKATGSSNGAAYSFNDLNISIAGNYLYRLKFINQDGSFSYSSTLPFAVTAPAKLIVLGTVFSNKINVVLPYTNGTAEFSLLDAVGAQVYTSTIAVNGTASQTLVLPNSNLARGIYVLELIINGEKFTQKLVKK